MSPTPAEAGHTIITGSLQALQRRHLQTTYLAPFRYCSSHTLTTLTTWKVDQLFYCLPRWRGDSDRTRTHWGHACSRNHYRCIQLPICHRTPLCTPPPLRLWLLSQNMPYTWLMSVIFVHFGYCQFHHAALASHCRCDMQQNDANPVDLHTLGPSILFPRSVLKWPSKSRNEQIWIYDSPIC